MNEYWLRMWAMIIGGFVLILLAIVSCNMHIDYRISKAIENGATPLEAKAAFTTQPSDALYLISKGKL